MHPSVIEYTRLMIERNNLNDPKFRVLEVGSQDFNGSVRPLFDKVADYIGTDMLEGKGVDIVVNAHNLDEHFAPNKFDLVISTEMLEHDSMFWISIEQMRTVLKPGGHLLLTARGVSSKNEVMWEHGYPYDYYRFMPQSFKFILEELAGCEVIDITEDTFHPGWFGLGRKL